MPIPALIDGVLPPGVHDCTLEEIRARFGGFRLGSSRWEFANKLEDYLREARTTSLIVWIGVDGSFVTDKEDPNDVDIVIALRPDYTPGMPVLPYEYNLFSRRRLQQRYPFDVLSAAEGTDALQLHLAWFQRTRQGHSKGILRVRP